MLLADLRSVTILQAHECYECVCGYVWVGGWVCVCVCVSWGSVLQTNHPTPLELRHPVVGCEA